MFLYRSKRQVHTYTNLEKAIQFIYLSENVHVQVHDVPGDGNCLYHCLFFLYRKYSLKSRVGQVSFQTTQQLKEYLIRYRVSYMFFLFSNS